MATETSPLSSWARNVSPSPTLAVDAQAKALIAAGEDVAGFGAGEPDFDTPEFVKEAAIEALRAGKTKYVPAAGIMELRRALADRYRAVYGVTVEPAQVIVSPGGKYSCYLSILAVCSPGDEVIIPAPYWVSYPEMVKLAGAVPRIIFAGDRSGFKITPEQLAEAITPRSRMLVLNSPSNPTGAVYSRDEVESLVRLAVGRGLFILSDEIYEDLLYDGLQATCAASLGADVVDSVIVASGFSKTYSMTGWRLGTTVAPKLIAKAIANLQSQTSSNATSFAQYGALAALSEREKARAALAAMMTAFDRRRRFLHAGLNEIPGVQCLLPGGAFYVFPNISSFGLDSTAFASRLLDEEKVALVPGVAFGADDYVRLSYATSDEVIKKGLERLTRFCAGLNR